MQDCARAEQNMKKFVIGISDESFATHEFWFNAPNGDARFTRVIWPETLATWQKWQKMAKIGNMTKMAKYQPI